MSGPGLLSIGSFHVSLVHVGLTDRPPRVWFGTSVRGVVFPTEQVLLVWSPLPPPASKVPLIPPHLPRQYTELWRAVIRPPRDQYEIKEGGGGAQAAWVGGVAGLAWVGFGLGWIGVG